MNKLKYLWQTTAFRFRLILLCVWVCGLSGSVFSLFAQYVLKQNPCVMCIQQRLAMMSLTVLAFLFYWVKLKHQIWSYFSASIITLPAVFGAYIAAKQLYLQSLPINEQPSCGAPWTFRWRGAPLFDWYEPIIRGTGACGEVHRFLGVSLPMWSLLFFMGLLLILWWGVRASGRDFQAA